VPALTNSFSVNSAAQDASTLVTSTFAPSAGDLIVVKGVIESTSLVQYNTPTDDQGNTYTLQDFDDTASSCWVGLWTAVATSSAAMTVSLSITSTDWHSMVVEDWDDASLASTPALAHAVGSGSPQSTMTTVAPGSVVSWLNGDWNAVNPTGHVYDSTSATPVEDGLHYVAAAYVAYYAYQAAVSAGSQTLGLTAPTGQQFSTLGIEILDATPPSGPVDTDQYRYNPWT
jgi:hypothetical protein